MSEDTSTRRPVAPAAPAETVARTLLPWLFSERVRADDPLRDRIVRGLATSAAAADQVTALIREHIG